MTEFDKEKLSQIIDACIDASANLHHIEIVVKGLRNEIDEISTKLYFDYKKDDKS